MDEEVEIKKVVDESLKNVSSEEPAGQAKMRNPFKSLRLKKKKATVEEATAAGSTSTEKIPKAKKAKNEKISRNFTIRGSLGRKRKVADRKVEIPPVTPEGLERQTPEGGSPLSVSDATLSEIEPKKAPPGSPNTASAKQSERIVLPSEPSHSHEGEKPHRVETVADRVSAFQQLTTKKSSHSTIRSKITRKFHATEATAENLKEKSQKSFMQQETEVSSKEAEGAEQGGGVNFSIGTAVRHPPGLSLLRHITSLESDSEEASGSNFLEEPHKSHSPSERSLRRIAYVAGASSSGSQEDTANNEETLEIGLKDKENLPESDLAEDCEKMPAHGDLIADNVGANMTPSGQTSGGKKEHLYKILVIGELGTGKTSFIKRYVHQFFSNNYRATIGVDFALKVIPWDENTIVRLQLWDIAGQERFGNMTRVYYKEAVGAFIVFDVTRSATFDAVAKWKQDLDAKVQLPDGSNIPCVLLANKCDQEKQGFVCNSAKMDEYVRENKFTAWYETSAKENVNIEESAKALVTKILINDKTIVADPGDDDKVMLTNSTHSTSKSCAC
ncbi:ras and EF-hand domain-containing protein isoform X1 [Lutzomyia longipalpis]|nr:ras and EF-hand domain-containing protein isoform X1 [Lutzomyia longipalpis]